MISPFVPHSWPLPLLFANDTTLLASGSNLPELIDYVNDELVEFFKLQFMQQYVRGPSRFPSTTSGLLIRAHRAQATTMVLRNDAEFFIPTSRHAQCSLLSYHSFPCSWGYFDQPNPTISILRNKKEFNTELKTYFIKKLSSAFLCNRLFCPSCSSTKTQN